VVLAVLLVFLATSWLGVLAFHGDLLHQRIRFLAERGVSPGKVWATRHAVPLSLLAVLLVVVLGLVEVSARIAGHAGRLWFLAHDHLC
jgi:hypothetical protein